MRDKIVKPERRRPHRLAALAEAVEEAAWFDRRVHCWNLEPTCTEERRKRCSAYYVLRNCWDLWAAEYFPPGRKPCCHPEVDCSECPVTAAKFSGPVPIHVAVPGPASETRATSGGSSRAPTCCPYLYTQKDPQLEKAGAEARPVFRCQRRAGIMLHSTYISEVCSCPEHRECTFFGAGQD